MGLSYTSLWIFRLVPHVCPRPELPRRPRLQYKNLTWLLFLTISLASSARGSCPSTLFTGELESPPQGHRDSLYLFAKKRERGRDTWQQIPFQIDPVDPDGRLVFPGDKLFQESLSLSELMTFRTDTFGQRLHFLRESLPCSGDVLYELQEPKEGRFAYLTQCQTPFTKSPIPLAAAFEPSQHLIAGLGYKYYFNPANYLQFDNVEFLNREQAWESIARDSRMLIRSDVKRFFTMHFDSRQIESTLEKTRLGPVADLARLSFFLRILFFRLDISLSTDVAFFHDAGHIPMMINIPVQSEEWLHPRSGVLYTWILSDKARKSPQRISMPLLDVDQVKKGWKELAPIGLAHCQGQECPFKFGVNLGGRHLIMEFTLKRELVARGFFPLFVKDVETFKQPMDWNIDSVPGTQRMGMYFEVSGLPKGGHPWNFWLKMGGQEAGEEICPAPYSLRRLAKTEFKSSF